MLETGMRMKAVAYALALGGLTAAAACGGTSPPPPAAPPLRTEPVSVTPSVPATATVTTDREPAQRLGPMLFGVDLDTVRSGVFDQGKMWTFEFPPTDYIAETYGFRPDAAWFEKARLGALRLSNCSASFVSATGLVMTNHHCGREFVTQVQRPGENLLDGGFYAKDLTDERPVEDFRADQLIEIVDVTSEVNARVDAASSDERADVREQVLEEIEDRLTAEKGAGDADIVVEMVSLYNGGRTSAYVFRRYTDAKLVMAPELQIGFFGGDPDNFTYPRYNMDVSFFRLYDATGDPLRNDVWFSVDADGLEEGDAVFVIGNPGSTSRLQTVAELEFRRDVSDRAILDLLRTRMAILEGFIERFPEEAEARDLRNEYFGLSNSEKAYSGQVGGLEDPIIIARRRDNERRFQAAIDADPTLRELYGNVIARMAALQEQKREQAAGFGAFLAMTSSTLESATLYRALMAFQVLGARGGGASPSQVDELLDETRAIPQQHPEWDRALLAARLHDFVRYYGAESDLARRVLQGRTPEDVAASVTSQSMLADSARAVRALESGSLSVSDPALQLFQAYLPAFGQYQQAIYGLFPEEAELSVALGRARFEVYGTDVPPDATFSLRIADGVVGGYAYNGTRAPAFTTVYGLYDRHFSHVGDADWALPARWLSPPAGFDLGTPMNFASTNDIIGGNSGSPVLDKDLEVVGLVFDGNIESLPGDYIYLPELNRAVSVDIRTIVEALDHIYDMDRLVLELTGGRFVPTEAEADRIGR